MADRLQIWLQLAACVGILKHGNLDDAVLIFDFLLPALSVLSCA